jgi:hypothetical protein
VSAPATLADEDKREEEKYDQRSRYRPSNGACMGSSPLRDNPGDNLNASRHVIQ